MFKEAFRVLKPGGRLAISDVVSIAALPDHIRDDPAFHVGCIAGASSIDELRSILVRTGFEKIRIRQKAGSKRFIDDWTPGRKAGDYVVSATIEAVKPQLQHQT